MSCHGDRDCHGLFCLVRQVLRTCLQGVTSWLGSGVKDGVVACTAEDPINELQRQIDFERSIGDHQNTLEMSRRLQEATEEVTSPTAGTFIIYPVVFLSSTSLLVSCEQYQF